MCKLWLNMTVHQLEKVKKNIMAAQEQDLSTRSIKSEV